MTCDWGHCDEPAVSRRFDPDSRVMLPVCDEHRGEYALAA